MTGTSHTTYLNITSNTINQLTNIMDCTNTPIYSSANRLSPLSEFNSFAIIVQMIVKGGNPDKWEADSMIHT